MSSIKARVMSLLYYFIGPPFLIILAFLIQYRFKRYWEVRNKLRGKVVLITGASSGLGEALCYELYPEGCKLILASRRIDQLELVVDNLKRLSSKYETFTPRILQLDLSDLDSIPNFVNSALKIHGRIDILINNAGVSVRGSTLGIQQDIHQRIMTVNYFGTLCLTSALLPHMISQKSGQIAMINSVQGKFGLPYRSAYGASKHALLAYTDSLRAEISNHGINVLSICPGYIKTSLSSNALGIETKVDDTAQGYEPEYVSREIISALKYEKKEVIISPITPKLAILIRTLLPDFYFFIMKKRADKLSHEYET